MNCRSLLSKSSSPSPIDWHHCLPKTQKGFRQISLRGTASNRKSAEFIKRCCEVRGIKLGPDGKVIDEEDCQPEVDKEMQGGEVSEEDRLKESFEKQLNLFADCDPEKESRERFYRCPQCGNPAKGVFFSERPSWKVAMHGLSRPEWYL